MSISPNVPSPQESYHYENSGTPRWIAVLFGVLFVALAAMGFFGYTAQSRMSQELAKAEDNNKLLVQRLDQANASLADLKGHVEVTEGKLGMTTAELAKAKSRAESIRKDQIAADQKLSTQLAQAQKESEEKIGAVATDLGGAKKDIETTRNDLESTKGKSARRHIVLAFKKLVAIGSAIYVTSPQNAYWLFWEQQTREWRMFDPRLPDI